MSLRPLPLVTVLLEAIVIDRTVTKGSGLNDPRPYY
jgi:hypothetical protein